MKKKMKRLIVLEIDENETLKNVLRSIMEARSRSSRNKMPKEPHQLVPATRVGSGVNLVSHAVVLPSVHPPPHGLSPIAMKKRSRKHAVVKDPQQNVPASVTALSPSHNAIDLVSPAAISSYSLPPDNHKDANHIGKAISSTASKPAKKKRIKKFVDTIDFPRSCVRGKARGQNKLDSTTFDNILEIIWHGLSEEKRSSFACLDSMWFCLYSQKNFDKEKVLKWIKKKDIIFSKHYVFIPIVMWSHWSLLILCHFGEELESKDRTPCMLLLDSMQLIGPRRLEPDIRKFVFDIHKSADLSVPEIPLLVPKVPQQKDGEECGRYVLYFINLFLENAPECFNVSEGYPYFMKKDWFSVEELDNFWQRCNTLLMKCNEKDEGKGEENMGIQDEDIIEITY